jgi:Nucleotide-diphospho-sugar transferase
MATVVGGAGAAEIDSIRGAIFRAAAGTAGIVWITLINAGYVDYTRNFLKSMDVHGRRAAFPLIVYCIDETSMDELQDVPHCIAFDASIFLRGSYSPTLALWEQPTYNAIVYAKLDAIQFTIRLARSLTNVKAVGYMDTDIVLFSNPNTLLHRLLETTDAHVISSCDENKLICYDPQHCQHMCSGTMLFRLKGFPEELFYYSNQTLKAYTGNQTYLMKQFKAYALRTLTVDKQVFLHGTYPGLQSGTPIQVPETAALIHFNYMIDRNYRKRECMKEQAMWYLDPAAPSTAEDASGAPVPVPVSADAPMDKVQRTAS